MVRSLLPSGKTGTVLEWTLSASTEPGWTRETVIGHSQVGYHPAQRKVAVLETDRNAPAPGTARLLRVDADGSTREALAATPRRWGQYLRYDYYPFDFSDVREPGLYQIEAAGQRTAAFRIAATSRAKVNRNVASSPLAPAFCSVAIAFGSASARSHLAA